MVGETATVIAFLITWWLAGQEIEKLQSKIEDLQSRVNDLEADLDQRVRSQSAD